MTTRVQIANELKNISTGFSSIDKDGNKVEMTMDNFGSFLSCKNPLPSTNQEIIDLCEKAGLEISPNNIREVCAPVDYTFDNDEFFKSDKPFNDKYLFVGLNMAFRPGERNYADWKNFHDMSNFNNTTKMYLEVNDERFRGCYITDVIKKSIESDSEKISLDFFLNDNPLAFCYEESSLDAKRIEKYRERYSEKEALKLLESNKKAFNNSANIFAQEIKVINPEQIIVFGGSALTAIKQMKESEYFKNDSKLVSLLDNAIEATHYSYYGKGSDYGTWIRTKKEELLDKLE